MTSVAHLKALIIPDRNLDRPVAWQNSYLGHALLKKAILLLKMANVPFDLLIAVYILKKVSTVVCSGLWNLIVFQVKFNRFLHPNSYNQSIL